MQTTTTGKTKKKGAYTTSGQATSLFLGSGEAADGTDEAAGPASSLVVAADPTARTAHTSADHAGRDVVCVWWQVRDAPCPHVHTRIQGSPEREPVEPSDQKI